MSKGASSKIVKRDTSVAKRSHQQHHREMKKLQKETKEHQEDTTTILGGKHKSCKKKQNIHQTMAL